MQIVVSHGDISEAGYYFLREYSVQYDSRPPYSFAAVGYLKHDPLGQIQASQFSYPRSHSLPLFPIDCSDSAAQPFVCVAKQLFHICHFEVIDPSYNVLFQFEDSVFIAPSVVPIRQLSYSLLHLFHRLWVYSKSKALVIIERIAQIFNLADMRHTGFLPVDLEKQLQTFSYEHIF